jgi:hypothetical protein
MKTTKSQARECYDSFFATLRNLNGGTTEENRRSAPRCLHELEQVAARASVLAASPSKALAADAWLMDFLACTIHARLASFRSRYN